MNEKDILRLIQIKEQALKENLLLTSEAEQIQKDIWGFLDKNLPSDSIVRLRYRKLRSQTWTWWSDKKGFPSVNAWAFMIEPFVKIFNQFIAGKTIKRKLKSEDLFIESRLQGDDEHILVGNRDGSGEKAHVVIDGKTGEIRVEEKEQAPEKNIAKIETVLTTNTGKKIKFTREMIEELKEEKKMHNLESKKENLINKFLAEWRRRNVNPTITAAIINNFGTIVATVITGIFILIVANVKRSEKENHTTTSDKSNMSSTQQVGMTADSIVVNGNVIMTNNSGENKETTVSPNSTPIITQTMDNSPNGKQEINYYEGSATNNYGRLESGSIGEHDKLSFQPATQVNLDPAILSDMPVFNELIHNKEFFVTKKDNQMYVTMTIRDDSGKVLAKLENNEWSVNPSLIFDRNYNQNTLEVIDQYDSVILKIRLKNSQIFYQGILFDTKGNGWMIKEVDSMARFMFLERGKHVYKTDLKRIFKYPSGLHLGELDNGADKK